MISAQNLSIIRCDKQLISYFVNTSFRPRFEPYTYPTMSGTFYARLVVKKSFLCLLFKTYFPQIKKLYNKCLYGYITTEVRFRLIYFSISTLTFSLILFIYNLTDNFQGLVGSMVSFTLINFIITFSYSLAYQLWRILLNFDWLVYEVERSNVSTTNIFLQMGYFCVL